MKKYRIVYWLAAVCCLPLFTACNGFLREDPRDGTDHADAYRTLSDVYLNAVASLYNYVGGYADSQGLQGTGRGVYDLNTFTTDEAIMPTRGGDWYDGGFWQGLYLHKWGVSNDAVQATWEYLYKVKGDANRSNVFSAFFTPGSSAYVGDLAHVKNLICGHSYWTDGTWDGMRNVRKQVAQAAGQYNLDVWQSEWSMLGDNYSSSEFVGYEQASEMDIAFYMSKVIHNDLTVAGVSSWSYWTSMDVSRWGHKNRFLLISLVPAGGEYGDIEQEGSYQATATLWVLGNYSRFIRPGYRRIALDLNESRTFFGSAWLSPEGDKVVAVYTNMSDKAVRLGETHVGWSNEAKSIATYTTTGSKNLVEGTVAAGKQVILEAKSVTTVVYSLK
mgnify:CR=1 FL=1